MSEKIVTIQRGRGAWQGPESKAPVMPTAMRTLPTVTTGNASDTPVMCNDAAQLAALGADMGNHMSGDLISREAALESVWQADSLEIATQGQAPIADRIRALPAQGQPAAPARKVKALVWADCTDGTSHDIGCQYEAERDGKFWRVVRAATCGGCYVCHAQTLEAAKAAAQADYETRILAALEAIT